MGTIFYFSNADESNTEKKYFAFLKEIGKSEHMYLNKNYVLTK